MPLVPPDPTAVLDGLDDAQRAAVLAPRGPVCVLAGAGTGKTRAITHRVAYLVLSGAVPAGHVLAVTFTARAAGEMRARLASLGVPGVQAHTFHAAALRQLRYFWPRLTGGAAAPQLVDRKARLVAQALGRSAAPTDATTVRDLTGEIEWAKARMIAPEAYGAAVARAHRLPPLPAPTTAAVYAAYEELKNRSRSVDFDDLLLIMAGALAEHRDVAEEVRARYRAFVVDEYQDVNPLQQRLLDGWLGGREDLCVVGDVSQTIYTFNGASPSYLAEFSRRYPQATVVRLERDYRSTPQVVALANRLISQAHGSLARTRLRLVGQRPAGPAPTVQDYDDEAAEAAAVAERCRTLRARGVPAAQIAVLFRTNAQSEAYEQALGAAGVPYVVRGGERFFERAEIRRAITLLRGAARGAAVQDRLPDAVRDVLSATGFTPAAPPPGGAARERWESLAALVRLAEELAAGVPGAGLVEFVEELRRRAAVQHIPPVDGVTLASLHASKGLEWDAVFLVGLAEGTVPISYAVTDEQVEEERRLLYVGITRAREHLYLSWAASRGAGGRRPRQPSRFLAGLTDHPTDGHGATRPRGAPGRRREPARCRDCGAALADRAQRALGRCSGCTGPVDAELYERLRAWRRERAQTAGVPAYVVFNDATLTVIAQRRPGTPAELGALPGIGTRKLADYADDVLSVIRQARPGAAGEKALPRPEGGP